MEGSSIQKSMSPGWGMMSTTPESLRPDHLEKMHSQTDSFLTAARLLRGGWLEKEEKTWQFSHVDFSVRKPASEENQILNRAKNYIKDPRIRSVPIINSGKMTEDREMGVEKETGEAKQTPEGEFSANKQAGIHTGGVRIWTSHCRIVCRKSRRFKAPILPVITEI